MSTYNFHGSSPGQYEAGYDLELLTRLAALLVEALSVEYPHLVPHGQVVQDAVAEAVGDGLPPNRGRIRINLENVMIGARAGTASLGCCQQLLHELDL
ncbi:hypothetical protein ACGFYV_19975 [Streptomyces sp. NPDC048297]|uniref:hypothetical protein n=1 Tax=Streptomyces sp. NPDC048297 TaxID=3365531 RepID=UPI00371C833B